jgi:uncharacterized protein
MKSEFFQKLKNNSKINLFKGSIGLIIVFIIWQIIGSIPFVLWISFIYSDEYNNLIFKSEEFGTYFLKFIFTKEPFISYLFLLSNFLIGLGGMLLVCKYYFKINISNLINASKDFNFKKFIFAFLSWIAIISIFFLIDFTSVPTDYQLNSLWLNSSPAYITLIIISVILLSLMQTFFEEIFFRGLLIQVLNYKLNIFFTILTSGILFGLMHLGNIENLYGLSVTAQYFLVGWLFSIITLLTNGIETTWGIHFGNNLFLSLIVTSSNSSIPNLAIINQIVEKYSWQDTILITFILVLYCLIFKLRPKFLDKK